VDVENVFQKEKYRIILQIKSVKCELQGLNDIRAQKHGPYQLLNISNINIPKKESA